MITAEARAAHNKKYYEGNKEKFRERTAAYIARNYAFVNTIKSGPCTDCGGKFHPAAMDFDHIADNKVKNVAKMVVTPVSIKKLQEEIDKCELVCANCHRVRTYERGRI